MDCPNSHLNLNICTWTQRSITYVTPDWMQAQSNDSTAKIMQFHNISSRDNISI